MTKGRGRIMSKIGSLAALSILLLAAGCADPDSVLFVTVTNIGIDADTKPANVTIGYDRYEGYIGPTYGTGAIPPVVARIESNLAIFNPEIRQVYATGDAAKLVTGNQSSAPSNKALSGKKRLAFFGTGTNIGLKVAFMANAPESISFGYKRKEFSFIPLGKTIDKDTGVEIDAYGSVLASIDMNVNTPSLTTTKLGVSQFFATGIAAEQLASTNAEIRQAFKKIAAQAVTLGGKYVKDAAGNKLRTFWKPDGENINPENQAKIKLWMKKHAVDSLSITFFMRNDMFADARIQAVDDLGL